MCRPDNQHQSNRTMWIDYLRGIGIFLMIVGHAAPPVWLRLWIYGFHMPLFYIVSGYLHHDQRWSQEGYKRFVISRLKSLILPYYLWCAICFVINLPILYVSYPGKSFLNAILQNIGWIVTSVKIEGIFMPQNCTPLWFLTSLFLSLQIFYWVKKTNICCQCLISCAFIFINYLLDRFNIPILPWHLDVSLIGAVFMLIGYHIRVHQLLDRVRHPLFIVPCFILATVCIMFNEQINMYYRQYHSSYLLFFAGAVLMTYSFMWVCARIKKPVAAYPVTMLGQYSMIVLGINYSVNHYVHGVCEIISQHFFPISAHWMVLTVINLGVCALCIYLFRHISAKHPRFGILIGQ